MKAMVLKNICDLRENKEPLEMVDFPDPVPGEREVKNSPRRWNISRELERLGFSS